MMADPRVFTLEEANALVPRLTRLVGRQVDLCAEVEARLAALCEANGELPEDLAPLPEDTNEVRGLKEQLVTLIATYQAGWAEVEQLGAVVKDARKGLLDFYGRVEGTLVWLCWKIGEPEIAHYHGLHEGFGGRKPIDPEARKNLLN